MRVLLLLLCVAAATSNGGCRSTAPSRVIGKRQQSPPTSQPVEHVSYREVADEQGAQELPKKIDALKIPASAAPEQIPPPPTIEAPTLSVLADSVRRHYPLIQQAVASRTIASGEVLASQGSFDRKLQGFSNSQPLDFYENHRHSLGISRDTFWGGELFAGYRIGRGSFEPWYLERETNRGGEFNAGFVVPLARDISIDANRAELWRSQLERSRVEPEIRGMIIGAVRDATVAYWQWVATAAHYEITQDVLQLGLDRKRFLKRQVELGEKAQIDVVDNERIILTRSAKATDARRKLEQAAVKLSLFLRDDLGQPIVTPIDAAQGVLPPSLPAQNWGEQADVALAQANRPELAELQLARRQLAVLLRQACNEMLPEIDAGLLVAQDVGQPTSALRDKSELELEATITLSVPLERRRALGKARQLRGKIAQLRAKMRFASDKIALEAQVAHAALTAAAQRVDQTTQGLNLAKQMEEAERRRYELGESTLFNLNLREQQAVEAAVDRIAALYDYHVAQAEYAAALGFESIENLTPLSSPRAAL